ncbi:MAG: helix-turn-helix transcriptional regulator [Myxococcota bacterium]
MSTAPCLEGLSLPHNDAGRVGARLDWNEVALFLNCCAQDMSPAEQEAMGELYPLEDRYLHLAARTIRSPRLVFHLVALVSQAGWRHMRFFARDLDEEHVEIRILLPERYVPCPVFFRGMAGEWRGLVQLLGLGDCEVEADVGPWHGRYRIQLPQPSGPDGSMGRLAQRMLEPFGRELAHLVAWILSQDIRDGGDERVVLQRQHRLSWMETHVAMLLARGHGVEQIAVELGQPVDAVRRAIRGIRSKTGSVPR